MAMALQSIKSIETVLDLAIWLEKHGQEFYEKALAAVDNAELQALFSYLAAEEQQHCATYKQLYANVTGKPIMQEDLFGEYGHFIDLLIAEVTTGLTFDQRLSPMAILEKALIFEKNTLLYFTEIKNLFAGDDLRAIEAICAEEKKHLTRLLHYRRSQSQQA